MCPLLNGIMDYTLNTCNTILISTKSVLFVNNHIKKWTQGYHHYYMIIMMYDFHQHSNIVFKASRVCKVYTMKYTCTINSITI